MKPLWSLLRQLVRTVRRRQFANCGRRAHFDPFGRYEPPRQMHFGENIYIGPGAIVSAHEGFWVGDNTVIGPTLLSWVATIRSIRSDSLLWKQGPEA
jgi:hypothetical protein